MMLCPQGHHRNLKAFPKIQDNVFPVIFLTDLLMKSLNPKFWWLLESLPSFASLSTPLTTFSLTNILPVSQHDSQSLVTLLKV